MLEKPRTIIPYTDQKYFDEEHERIGSKAPHYNSIYLEHIGYVKVDLCSDEIDYFIGNLKGKRILELGTGYGGTTALFCYAGSDVVTVDIFDYTKTTNELYKKRWEKDTIQNVFDRLRVFPNVVIMIGKTHDVVPNITNNSFDIIFIDADHTYEGAKLDFELSFDKLRDTGSFIFHDYDIEKEVMSMKLLGADQTTLDDYKTFGVKKLVDEVASKIQIIGSSAIVKKEDTYV